MSTEFYNDEYSQAYPDGIEKNYWNLARKKTILSVVRKFNLDNLLDVGCGRGIVTGYLFSNKINVTGVELGMTTPIENTGVKIMYNTDATTLPEETRSKFKTISLFDVIEHIEKPVEFIQLLSDKFRNVESLIITVPARQELWTNFDDYYGHFRRYTLESLQSELKQSGFRIKSCGYFFHSLYYMIRVSNMINKKRELKFDPPKGLSLIIHKFFGSLLFLESKLLPGKMLGSSVICVAEKIK